MAAKKKAAKSGAGGSHDKLEAAVKAALAALKTAKTALATANLAKLTAEERLHSAGRLREGEARALGTILDAMDTHPATFHVLADRDGGDDPRVLETAPARDALARRILLAPLAAELGELHSSVTDDLLASADLVKGLTVPAYAIAKANAAVDPKLRKSLSHALDFYAKLGRTRKAKTSATG